EGVGQVLGAVGGGHQVEVRPLDHQADRDVPPGVGAVGHDDGEVGEVEADPVEVDRFLAGTGEGWAGDAGVDLDRQVQFRASGVDGGVARVGRRQVLHEGDDLGADQWKVGVGGAQLAHGLHRLARVDSARQG